MYQQPFLAAAKGYTDQLALNVTRYGAVGDGVADDGAAIQAALDAAEATGGTVYMPPGTYRTTTTIRVPFDVTLAGAGRSTIIKLADAPDRALDTIWWRGTTTTRAVMICNKYDDSSAEARESIQGAGVRMHDFRVIGNTDALMEDGLRLLGVLFTSVENFELRDVEVTDLNWYEPPVGGVQPGYGITTRYCRNGTLIRPSGRRFGYQGLGCFDGSRDVTVIDAEFGAAVRTSGQIHRHTSGIRIVRGRFVNDGEFTSEPSGFLCHGEGAETPNRGNRLEGITIDITGQGAADARGLYIFGPHEDTYVDAAVTCDVNGGAFRLSGATRTFITGRYITASTTQAGVQLDSDATDTLVEGLFVRSGWRAFTIDATRTRVTNFDAEGASVGIFIGAAKEGVLLSNGRAKALDGSGVLTGSTTATTGDIVIENVECLNGGAQGGLNIATNMINAHVTVRNCIIDTGGTDASLVAFMQTKGSLIGNDIRGQLRLRNEVVVVCVDNRINNATISFVDTTQENHIIRNNVLGGTFVADSNA